MGNQAARSRRRAAERRRELRRRERAVVDAARLLCEPSGWSGVSSRGLAARSGVSTSRVHALFGSLDGVWAAVERAVWDDLRDGLLIEDDPLTLTAYLEHCLWFAGENPGEWQVLASGDGPPDDLLELLAEVLAADGQDPRTPPAWVLEASPRTQGILGLSAHAHRPCVQPGHRARARALWLVLLHEAPDWRAAVCHALEPPRAEPQRKV